MVIRRFTGRRMSRRGFNYVHLLVLTAIIALLIALLIPTVQRLRERANLIACKENLRRIGVDLIQYAHSNGGNLPVSPTVENPQLELINALKASKLAQDGSIFYCPAERRSQFSFSEGNFRSGNIGYYYYSAMAVSADPALSRFLRGGLAWPRKLNTGMDPRSWVMSDIWVSGLPTAHAGYRKGMNYLMLDGSVDFLTDAPRRSFH